MTLLVLLMACRKEPTPPPVGPPATPEPRAPFLQVYYPPFGRTDREDTTLYGSVIDFEEDLVDVVVAGPTPATTATVTDRIWELTGFPLGADGPIDVTVTATDALGLFTQTVVPLEKGPIARGPFLCVTLDPTGPDAFVTALQTLYRVDPNTGVAASVAELASITSVLATDGAQVWYATPNSVRVLDLATLDDSEVAPFADPPVGLDLSDSGALWVLTTDDLWRIDPGQTPVAVYLVPAIDVVTGLAVRDDSAAAYLALQGGDIDVLEIDLGSGQADVLSGLGIGGGPRPGSATGLALDESTERLLIPDDTNGSLYAVNIDSGLRFVLSEPTTGGDGEGVRNIASDDGQTLALDSHTPTLLSVSEIGERFERASMVHGTGPRLVDPGAAVWADELDELLVADAPPYIGGPNVGQLVSVHFRTGERTRISGPGMGVGPNLGAPAAVAMHPEGGSAFVLTQGARVIEVDLETGDRFLVSDGQLFDNAEYRMAGLVHTGDTIFVGGSWLEDFTFGQVVAIDIASGVESIIQDRGGPLAYDPETHRLFTTGGPFIEALDLTTGAREDYLAGDQVISLAWDGEAVWGLTSTGRLAAWSGPTPSLEMDWDLSRADHIATAVTGLLYGIGNAGVVAIDPVSGEHVVLSR